MLLPFLLLPLLIQPTASEPPGLIAFAAYDQGPKGEICVVRSDGTGLRNLSNNPNSTDNYPSWSPDGSQIAFNSHRSAGWHIWLMDADGKNPRKLLKMRGYNLNPSWSPDGKHIVFFANFDGDWSWDIGVVELATGNVSRLTRNKHVDRDPAWSPDGATIAFYSNRAGIFDLFTMKPDGSDVVNVTHTDDLMEIAPSWSPDGRQLAAYACREGSDVIQVITLAPDGSERREILRSGETSNVSYKDLRLSWSPSSKEIAYVSWAAGPQVRGQTMLVDVGTGTSRALREGGRKERDPTFQPFEDARGHFDFMLGAWVSKSRWMQADRSYIENQGRHVFRRAFEDHGMVDDNDTLNATGDLSYAGTAIRTFDPKSESWICRWYDAAAQRWFPEFTLAWADGTMAGETPGSDEHGSYVDRITFTPLETDAVHWSMERRYAGLARPVLMGEIHYRREK